MLKRITLAIALLLAPIPALAQSSVLPYFYAPSGVKTPVGSDNPFPVTGNISASLSPFTPGLSGARGTPLTVTTADSSGNLPTNTGSVIVSNVGSNPMYCNVNAVAATTADQLITSGGGWFNFGIPSGVTTLRCIATGGSTTANSVGGSGLGAGTGGGSGGGGGAVTIASGAVASGAFATGAGVDGWDITQGARADAAWTSGSGSVISLLKAIAAAEIVTNRAVNVAQINGVTPLMGNGATGTGSPRVTLSNDNTIPTGWPTAANQATQIATQGATTVAPATVPATAAAETEISLLKAITNLGATPLNNSSVAINVSTATTTQLVALSGSLVIYVTSFDVIAGGTGNITFVYGTGSSCGTGTTSLTGAYPLTAQAGIAKGSGIGTVLKVPAGNALCVLTSASVQMSGSVSYQQF